LQPLRRLFALPSGVIGPCERRPLARLASARAELFLFSVEQMEMSSVSTSVADIGGPSVELLSG
jgi:hypothetical protein